MNRLVRTLAPFALALTACPSPTQGVLRVDGLLDAVGDNQSYSISHADGAASGVWWPCDAMFSSTGCTNDRFVRVFLTLPTVNEIIDVGQRECVDDGGTEDDLSDDVADGVYEELLRRFADGSALTIGTDINVFVLVAADTDGEAGADVRDPAETAALTKLVTGSLEIRRLSADFNDEASFVINGATSGQGPVELEFRGPMSNPALVQRTVPQSSACVAPAPLE
jgi:hypothetical protein